MYLWVLGTLGLLRTQTPPMQDRHVLPRDCEAPCAPAVLPLAGAARSSSPAPSSAAWSGALFAVTVLLLCVKQSFILVFTLNMIIAVVPVVTNQDNAKVHGVGCGRPYTRLLEQGAERQ